MISENMKDMVSNSSIIRAMFEEGKRLSEIYGEENVFDFSIGNPSVEPPEEIKDKIQQQACIKPSPCTRIHAKKGSYIYFLF